MSTDEAKSPEATEKESEAEKGKEEPKAKKPAPAVRTAEELDESKINAPSRQDLVMLGTICVATLIMWAAGRAACNYNVPGESLTPRKVSLEDRTKVPKDVGIEFAQALSGGDFAIAAQLARAEAAAFVKKDKAECGACTARKKSASSLLSVGTVLQANSVDSIVSVRTIGPSGKETVRVLGIEREGRKWLVSRVYDSADQAELKEAPARDEAPLGIRRPEEEGSEGSEGAESANSAPSGVNDDPNEEGAEQKQAPQPAEKAPDLKRPPDLSVPPSTH